MRARILAYRLMVISPVLYIGSLAVRSHLHLNVFDFQACTQKQQDAITAYRPYVFDAEPFKDKHSRHVDRDKLRTVANSWVTAHARGQLKALLPVHVNDFVRDGIKQEVYRAADTLVIHLISVSHYEAKARNFDQAAADLMLALRLSEVLKYSDPYAVAHSGMQQRVALGHLGEFVIKLSPESRSSYTEKLCELRENQQSLDHLVRWMRQMYNADLVRKGRPVLPIEEVDRFFDESNSDPESGLAVFTSVPSLKWASAGEAPTMLGELRMASSSQTSFLERLDGVIKSLVEEQTHSKSLARK